jgi:hypothetical protein
MTHNKFNEIPIHAKDEMALDIGKIIHYLHVGKRKSAMPHIQDLKHRSVHLDEKIQQDVLMFVEQIEFQFAYDPWHNITEEVRKAADRLLHDLGLSIHRIAS